MPACFAVLVTIGVTVSALGADPLPVGSAPNPVEAPYFPSRLYEFVWKNWECENLDRMAMVAGATPDQIDHIGRSMGLPPHVSVSDDQFSRSYVSVIRRNWHLLPYDQMLTLLSWTQTRLERTLREDDVLLNKLGKLKPACPLLRYARPDEAMLRRAAEIKAIVEQYCGTTMETPAEPRFAFVRDLSAPVDSAHQSLDRLDTGPAANEPIRFLFSYFAVYGDPLIDESLDPFPDGLLQRLRRVGVNGVWIHVLLRQLAPSKEFPEFGENWQKRLANLRKLVDRAGKYGIRIYLYVNEPRAMPNEFFANRDPALQGVREGEFTAMCTSNPVVRRWMTDALRHVFTEVPGLGGVFAISASEDLTNCWSHYRGEQCPQCSKRNPQETVAEVNRAIAEGVWSGNPTAKVLVWDWGWKNEWCEGIINLLPKDVYLMSVSEWDLPMNRGGVSTTVGEYSMSAVGPGPRAKRNWEFAHKAGLKTIAKIQANCTWELSAVPYLPVMDLVAQHCEALERLGVQGMMLSWTLGGYPSPNLELVHLFSRRPAPTADEALANLASSRYGAPASGDALAAWTDFSKAFSEFPYHGAFLYNGPMQWGPANPLYLKPTGYHATMVGFPYDDLNGWRATYPPEVLAGQLEKVVDGWRSGLTAFERVVSETTTAEQKRHAQEDLWLARAAGIHFASAANQVRFIMARDASLAASLPADRKVYHKKMRQIASNELELAREMFSLTWEDSRLGYEASNQYNYYPFDLVEKIVNCEWVQRQLAE